MGTVIVSSVIFISVAVVVDMNISMNINTNTTINNTCRTWTMDRSAVLGALAAT